MGCIEGRGKEDDHRHHSYVGSSRSWRHAGGCDRELHPQGVAPLMARQMSLYNMTTEAPSEGTQLGAPPPSNTEIVRWLTEAMEVHKGADRAVISYVFQILGCPPMHPELGLVEFVSPSSSHPFPFYLYFLPVSCPLILLLSSSSLPLWCCGTTSFLC
jgi:hypothetical protein